MGADYHIRPITPDDAERVQAFIAGLSPESRYRRFMFALREASPAFLERLVNVDGHRNMALIAVVGAGPDERMIGVARYAAEEYGIDCEFAVVVADAWQGRGIGTTLTRMLFDHATKEGFRLIFGIIQADNERMLALARHLDLEVDKALPRQEGVRAWRKLN
jgi:acetyltransferase